MDKIKPLVKRALSFPVTIFMAGKYNKALKVLAKYCNDTSYCVTIKTTNYIYKGGQEYGIEVGLINYPRFPSDPATIVDKAKDIAEELRVALDQESYSIQTPHDTIWVSYRKGDVSE